MWRDVTLVSAVVGSLVSAILVITWELFKKRAAERIRMRAVKAMMLNEVQRNHCLTEGLAGRGIGVRDFLDGISSADWETNKAALYESHSGTASKVADYYSMLHDLHHNVGHYLTHDTDLGALCAPVTAQATEVALAPDEVRQGSCSEPVSRYQDSRLNCPACCMFVSAFALLTRIFGFPRFFSLHHVSVGRIVPIR